VLILKPHGPVPDKRAKQLLLAELTVCFETSFEEARERKEAKYSELVSATEQAGYITTLITLEVGSQGVPHLQVSPL